MRKINIKTKILLGFMGIFVIMLFTTIYLIFQIQNIGNKTALIYEHPLKVSNTIREIKIEINKCEQIIYQLRNAKDSFQLDSFINEISKRDSIIKIDFNIIYAKYLGNINDVDSAYQSYNEWEKTKNGIYILKKVNNVDSIDQLLKSKNQIQINNITYYTNKISDFAKNKADTIFLENIKAENNTYYISIVLIIIASLVVLFFSFYLSRLISKPIESFVNDANLLLSEQSNNAEQIVHKEEDLFGITINELRKSYLNIEQQNLEIQNKNVQLSIINN
jgi:hypothetical protein